jgi:4a-hydroxytetrahydrobiopterin dehydratase
MRDKTKLSQAEIDAFLAAHRGWKVASGQLERTFEFAKFLPGIDFVQRVAKLAEAEDHHPDLDIRYNKVTVRLTTHDAGGLTWRDTKLAAAFDELVK